MNVEVLHSHSDKKSCVRSPWPWLLTLNQSSRLPLNTRISESWDGAINFFIYLCTPKFCVYAPKISSQPLCLLSLQPCLKALQINQIIPSLGQVNVYAKIESIPCRRELRLPRSWGWDTPTTPLKHIASGLSCHQPRRIKIKDQDVSVTLKKDTGTKKETSNNGL